MLRSLRPVVLMLVLLATAVGVTAWERMRELARYFGFIPLLLVAVIAAIVVQVYRRVGQLADLRSEVAAIEGRQTQLSSEFQAQKLLQTVSASRETFRELIDSFDAAVFTVSLDGKIRATNKAFTQLTRHSFQEVIGRPLAEFVAEPTAQQLADGLEAFLARRHWSGLVKARLAAGGEWRYFDCVVQPVLQDDSVLAVTVIATDVTAQREREALFANLFETLSEPVWVASWEGRMVDGNPAMALLAGVSGREALLSSNLFDLVSEPGRQTLAEAMRRRETIRDLEVGVARAGSEPSVCIVNATPLSEVSGGTRYHGTFTDITRRRTIERKLAQEQAFRQQLLASLPDALVTLDEAGRFAFVSARAEVLFGRSASSLLSTPAADCFSQPDREEFEALLRESVLSPESCGIRELHLRGERGWRTLRVHAGALRGAAGETAGVVLSLRDVTELRRMEQELILSERMSALGQMIEGFAHELNNPLTAILGACELMREAGITPPQQRSFTVLESQVARARDLAQNLRVFSSPSRDGKVAVNVGELVKRAAVLRAHAQRISDVGLDLALDEPIEACLGSPPQLMQVFLNLFMNAEQACVASGKPERKIRVRVSGDAKQVRCTFQDDGPGIPPEIASRIFEPFFTTKRPQRGTGLGLSVCRSIVEAHGGAIEYSASPDGGSIFLVTLPTAVSAGQLSGGSSKSAGA